MSLLESLRFTRGDSPIHRLDPRAKFLLTLVFFASSVVTAKVTKEWLKTIKGASVIAAFIFITNLISFYYFRGGLTPSLVEYSAALTIRFIVLVTSFSVFFLTTSPDKLSLALEKARIPYEFNFAFITAIRFFVPVLADEAQTIMDAQRSRGLELDKGNFLSRVRNYIPILLPLIINSIRRSLELAEAMESRAFGASPNRTNLYELEMTPRDYLVSLLALVLLALAIYVRFLANWSFTLTG